MVLIRYYIGVPPLEAWLERLSALHRSVLRRAAADEGLSLVHVEVIQYLARCNRYSNTTQALSDYLGQTKGSISQSLSYLEGKRLVRRQQDTADRRVFHLLLTAKGEQLAERLSTLLDLEDPPALQEVSERGAEELLRETLRRLQQQHGLKAFGICRECRYNQPQSKSSFRCGLTGETLMLVEASQLCRDFDAA